MRDRVLEGHLKDFATQYDLANTNPSDIFCYFVNYCVLSRLTPETLELDEFHVDGGGDTGIDAIAILVNGHIVTSNDDIDFFIDKLGSLDVEFVFIQSKTSPKFEAGAIGNFLFGVKQFFDSEPAVKPNDDIIEYRTLKEYIFDHSVNMEHAPGCSIYYASAGKWCDDQAICARVKADTDELQKTGLFIRVEFYPLDAEGLKNMYRELRKKIVKEINFERHTILPKIDKVEEAYLGILPVREFLKFITDEEGNFLRNLFYDNIRDFQGDNPVNREIRDTLRESDIADKFVLLNNGITVVARSINKVGTMFKVNDYQIVNGCQTSNVLYRNREHITHNILVPLKLIVTDDPEVTNRIIKATNRQTEVKIEAFESLSPFHRKLEEFYASFDKNSPKRLYYERRSKQYANIPIKPSLIISLATQTKAFLAMFLNEPHSTPRYYGEILRSNLGKMFVESHSPYPYYTSGFALVLIDNLFLSDTLPRNFRRFKYHLMMLLRIGLTGKQVPTLDGKKANDCCEEICTVLWDRKRAIEEFGRAIGVVRTSLESFSGDKGLAHRLRSFTAHLIPNLKSRPRGRVKYFNHGRGFGFIELPGFQDVFVHYSAIKGIKRKSLNVGETVDFDLVNSQKGPQAENVVPISVEEGSLSTFI
ncbi:MAG TPA: AIPR family protein [Candidatus Deferrimicrobium sp.]|nr:AIPR family protein [Candidatus Deferrimicrobium sp.]